MEAGKIKFILLKKIGKAVIDRTVTDDEILAAIEEINFSERMPMNKEKKSRIIMLLIDVLIAAVLLVFDQFTKHLAVVHLKGQAPYVLIDGVLELQYLENRGSAFGMLQNRKCLFCSWGSYSWQCFCFSCSSFPNRRNSVLFIFCSR